MWKRGLGRSPVGGFSEGGGVPEGKGRSRLEGRGVPYRRTWIRSPTNRRGLAEGGTPRGCLSLCLTNGDQGGDQSGHYLATTDGHTVSLIRYSTACRIPSRDVPDLCLELARIEPDPFPCTLQLTRSLPQAPHAIAHPLCLFPTFRPSCRISLQVSHRLYSFRTPSWYFLLNLLLPSVCTHYYALTECKNVPESLRSASVILYSIRYQRILYVLPQSTRTFLPPP